MCEVAVVQQPSFLLAISMFKFSWEQIASSVEALEADGRYNHMLCRRYREFLSAWPQGIFSIDCIFQRPVALKELSALWHEAVPYLYPKGHAFHDDCINLEQALVREAQVAQRVYGGPLSRPVANTPVSTKPLPSTVLSDVRLPENALVA
jgi:hypothetical protein